MGCHNQQVGRQSGREEGVLMLRRCQMQRMPLRPHNPRPGRAADEPIPFPGERSDGPSSPSSRRDAADSAKPRDPTGDALAALAKVSRRINDLARELKCLGYFDDGDDRPRAA